MGAPSLATSQGCGLKYLVLFCAGLFNARARLRTGFARREIPISRMRKLLCSIGMSKERLDSARTGKSFYWDNVERVVEV